MSSAIVRPEFYEGEILPAADLVGAVDYARGQLARHERYLHTWGIAAGLVLSGQSETDASGNNYQNVSLSAGVAVDGNGRELVVPAAIQLDPNQFQMQVAPQPGIWYPVYLSGSDQAAPASSALMGACNSSQSSSTQEQAAISFGTPGSELSLATQTASAFSDGAGDGGWLILVGYVQCSTAGTQFLECSTNLGDGSPVPNHVGVNASEVVSGSGSLLLATHPPGFSGSNPVMGMQIQEASSGPQLVFGQLNAAGSVSPALLTVTSAGDLIVPGKISGAVAPGSVQVQSGIAFDGMTLPLPIGVDPGAVAAGQATVHTHVSVHYESLQPPVTTMTNPIAVPLECRVDPTTFQVYCRLQWFDLSAVAAPLIAPAACDYTVIVAVPASSGSGS
jgi:hypothetical protein